MPNPEIDNYMETSAEDPRAIRVTPRNPWAQEVTDTIEKVLAGRGTTHGDYVQQAKMGQALKRQMRRAPNYETMPDDVVDALEMITVKISRILMGNFEELDHWVDIQGYARLVANRLEGTKK